MDALKITTLKLPINKQRFTVAKLDEAQKLVFGWASVAIKSDDLLVDRQGDMIAPEVLEEAAYDFVEHSRIANEMHKGGPIGVLVESLMVTPEKLEAMGLMRKSAPKAGLWVGVRVSSQVFQKVNKLKNLVLRAIALVDRGANQEARVVLTKRDDAEDAPMREAEHGSMDECMAAGKTEAECKELMAAMKRAEEEQMPDKLPEDVTKALAEVADLKKRATEAEAAQKAAETRIAKMEDERQREVFIAKAQEFKDLPGANPDDLGPILRKAYGVWTPEEQQKVEAMLRGAVKIAQDSALFQEIGAARPAVGSALDKLNAKANELVQKDGKMTFAQAFAKVCDTDEGKAFYHQHEQEEASKAGARRVR